jgi:hypothetical protein
MPVPLGFLRLSLMAVSVVLLVVRHFLHPRLPVYLLQLKYNTLPQFRKSPVTQEWQSVIPTQVQFYNANYLHLTVHALTFDLYLEDVVAATTTTQGNSLIYIGTITDAEQHHLSRRPDTTVLWSIRARSNFIVDHCPLHMSVHRSRLKWRSLLQILIRWWAYIFHKDLPFTLPTTGVAHIRASSFPHSTSGIATTLSSVPLTVSVICDNAIDVWRMQVLGTDCILRSMLPGWIPLNTSVPQLRAYAVSKLRVHPNTGSVIPSPILSMPSFTDLMSTLAWEEALQHL